MSRSFSCSIFAQIPIFGTRKPRKHLYLKRWVSVLCICGFNSFAADFSEEIKLVDQTWSTEVILDGAEPEAVVLMIHGWASQMDEVGDLYKRLAAQLADKGIASVRVNIRGESEREQSNYRLTSTFASRVEDAMSGLNYLRQNYPEKKIGVLGFSLGGATALEITGRSPEQMSSLLLWSTAGNPDLIFDDISPEQSQRLISGGEVIIPAWVDLTITREHFLGFQGYDPFPALKNYGGALFSIRGSEDYVPAQEQKILAAASASVERTLIIEGADHIFNVLEPASQHDERLIEISRDWFVETLLN